MPGPDPKVVLQEHALRVRATRHALVHGSDPPRTSHTGTGGLIVSLATALVAVIAVILVVEVIKALHGT
jgi:hypothetical protein